MNRTLGEYTIKITPKGAETVIQAFIDGKGISDRTYTKITPQDALEHFCMFELQPHLYSARVLRYIGGRADVARISKRTAELQKLGKRYTFTAVKGRSGRLAGYYKLTEELTEDQIDSMLFD